MKRHRPLSFVLCAASLAVLLGALAGCGQRGPLTLPSKPAPAASSAAKPEAAPSATAPATK